MATMSVHGLSLDDWERLSDPPGMRIELLHGQVVMNASPRPIHQIVALNLANRLKEACPPGLLVLMDVEWRHFSPDGAKVLNALRPDLSVNREGRLRYEAAITAPPVIAVEVRSPSNTQEQIRLKRQAYLAHGLGHYADVDIEMGPDAVTLRWYRAGAGSWQVVAQAQGTEYLEVDEPFAFGVTPNDLLD